MRHRITALWRLLLVLLTMMPAGAKAEVVSVERAAGVAARFLRLPATRGGEAVRLAWHSGRLSADTRAGEAPLYYVFEPTSGHGFVMVAGDDRVRPVLAYALQGKAPQPDRLPEGLAWWLGNISNQIRRARQDNASAAEAKSANQSTEVKRQRAEIAKQWSRGMAGSIMVLLETAEWNQGFPFNQQCPIMNGEYCLTGCSQTAAAIVMRYHRWPPQGRGVTEAYTTYSTGLYVPARNLNHAYDWDNMPTGSSGFTYPQGQAISTLMADIGRAAQADYGVNETSAYVGPELLYTYFDYSPDMYAAWRENYSDERWFSMVKGELDAARPLLYSGGGGSRGRHAFVLDGYTDDDYFHVNWGWGGYYSGFYTLEALNPGTDYYSGDQSAIFGVRPNAGGEVKEWLVVSDNRDIQLYTDEVEEGKPFFFSSFYFFNRTALPFDGWVRVGLVDREGKLKGVVSQECVCVAREGCYSAIDDWGTCTIKGPIDFGDRLRFYYKAKGSGEWHLIGPANDGVTNWQVPVVDELSIADATSLTFNRLRRSITLSTKPGVSATLRAEDGADLSSSLYVEDTTIRIPLTDLPAGTHTVRLTKGRDVKELSFTVKPYTR